MESKGKAAFKVQVKLPQLSTSIYIAIIETGGQTYREKVTIE